MPLLEHLGELRNRLIWVIASVAIAGIGGWVMFDRVIELLLRPAAPYLDLTDGRLIFTGPLEAFTLRFKVAAYVGFGIAFPVVLFHAWRFVSPGLRSAERRYAIPFLLAGIVLFGFGVWFAYETLPQALRWLIGTPITGQNVRPFLSAKQYIDFGLLYHAAFGLSFEFPIVLMALTLLRIVSSRQLAKFRRHVVVGIAVFVAVITPTVDWVTMGSMTLILYVFFEACIWISRLLRR